MEIFKILGTIALAGTDGFNRDIDEASSKGSIAASKIGKGFATMAKVTAAALGAAATAAGALMKSSIAEYAEYEQLAGGVNKIFNEMDTSKILNDAQNAYKTLNMSANEYLTTINDVGANFAATMGDEKGYETAQRGMQAISDYASGTGKSVGELMNKFTLIARATSSYQSIADQFSGILPATSKDFLAQAQAAGLLSDSYKELTEVPVAEYQETLSMMLEKGTADLGLANNTAMETASTITGSLAATKAAWSNLITGFADDSANLGQLTENFVDSLVSTGQNIGTRLQILVPRFAEGITQLCNSLLPMLPGAIEIIAQGIAACTPAILAAGGVLILALLQGITMALGTMLSPLMELFNTWIIQPIRDSFDQVIGICSSTFESVKTGINEKLTAAAEIVRNAIEKIKAFFDFEWELPHIKLPHFRISGKFSLNPPSIPHFSVEWYKKGGIMTDPTLFGFNPMTNKAMVGGEAGAEAIAPIETLKQYVAEAVASQNRGLAGILERIEKKIENIVIEVHTTIDIDGATVARKTYKHMIKQTEYHGDALIKA